mmetsp:Transcript_14301/g.26940  ORF Transcript_14301/g.26940 Transcript_14301/m.26940 type:complete len:165 (+) Transcript_14301:378-872(+)
MGLVLGFIIFRTSKAQAIINLYITDSFIFILGICLLFTQSLGFLKKLKVHNFNGLIMKQMSIHTTGLLVTTLVLKTLFLSMYVYIYYEFGSTPFEDFGTMSGILPWLLPFYFFTLDIMPKCIMMELLQDLTSYRTGLRLPSVSGSLDSSIVDISPSMQDMSKGS